MSQNQIKSGQDKSEITPQFLAEKTFDLYQTFGVPIEVSEQILEEKGLELDRSYLHSLIEGHQKLSQQASQGQFKSGLGQDNAKTRALHTTTHILHSVLRKIWGESLRQMGSAILEDKARFDINLEAGELGEEKIKEIEDRVQKIIDKDLIMQRVETSQEEAKNMGAIGLFGEKYGDVVSVYQLKEKEGENVYSVEFCAGPHIQSSKDIQDLGNFKILRKKSIGQGLVRLEFDLVKDLVK